MKYFVLCCVGISLSVTTAFAGVNEFDSCRCNNGIATKGDTKIEVRQDCGNPTYITSNSQRGCPELWVYNFGPNEFMQAICFDRSGIVKKVLSLDKGF